MPAPPRVRKKTKEVGVIDEIAGTGYEETGRDIPCSVDGCEWRFTREYDLNRHVRSMHEKSEEMDIDDSLESYTGVAMDVD
jgi:general transcription factor IIIA